MAKWSKSDERALLTAWRDARRMTGDPRSLRTRTHALYASRRNGPVRLLEAVWYKLRSMENMARVIVAFEACIGGPSVDGDGGRGRAARWFALGESEKHHWFARLNTRSYSYRELTSATFRFLADTMGSDEEDGEPEEETAAGDGCRVRLRRASGDSKWTVAGSDRQQQEPSPSLVVATESEVPTVEPEPTSDATEKGKETEPDDAEGEEDATVATAPSEASEEPLETTVPCDEHPVPADDEYDGSSTESDSDFGDYDDYDVVDNGDSGASQEHEGSQVVDSAADDAALKPQSPDKDAFDGADNGDSGASQEHETSQVVDSAADDAALEPQSPDADAPSDTVGPVVATPACGGDHQSPDAPTAIAPPPPDTETQRVPLNELLTIVSVVETQAKHLKHMIAQAQREKEVEQKARLRNDRKLKELAKAVQQLTLQLEKSPDERRQQSDARMLAETAQLRELQQHEVEKRRYVQRLAKATRTFLLETRSKHERELADIRAEVASLRAMLQTSDLKSANRADTETQQPNVSGSNVTAPPLAPEGKRAAAAPASAPSSEASVADAELSVGLERAGKQDRSSPDGADGTAAKGVSDCTTPGGNGPRLVLASYVKVVNKKAKQLAATATPQGGKVGSSAAVLAPKVAAAASVTQGTARQRAASKSDASTTAALADEIVRAMKPIRPAVKQPTQLRETETSNAPKKAETVVTHDAPSGKSKNPAGKKGPADTTVAATETAVSVGCRARPKSAMASKPTTTKPKVATQPNDPQAETEDAAEKTGSKLRRLLPASKISWAAAPIVVQSPEPTPAPEEASASLAVATPASFEPPPSVKASPGGTESAKKTSSTAKAKASVEAKKSAKAPPPSSVNPAVATPKVTPRPKPAKKRKRAEKESGNPEPEASQPAAKKKKKAISREVTSSTDASTRQQQQPKSQSAANRATTREDPTSAASAGPQSKPVGKKVTLSQRPRSSGQAAASKGNKPQPTTMKRPASQQAASSAGAAASSTRISATVDTISDEVKENKAMNTRDSSKAGKQEPVKAPASSMTAAEVTAPKQTSLLAELQPTYRTRASRTQLKLRSSRS